MKKLVVVRFSGSMLKTVGVTGRQPRSSMSEIDKDSEAIFMVSSI